MHIQYKLISHRTRCLYVTMSGYTGYVLAMSRTNLAIRCLDLYCKTITTDKIGKHMYWSGFKNPKGYFFYAGHTKYQLL